MPHFGIPAWIDERAIEDRRVFHQYPGTAFQEQFASRYIKERLDQIGIDHIDIAGTGVIGYVDDRPRGPVSQLINTPNDPRPVIGLYAELDGYPAQQAPQVGSVVRSLVPGVAELCGHDVSKAALLGAASTIHRYWKDLPARFIFLFAPAEESGKGMRRVIRDWPLHGRYGLPKPDVFGMIHADRRAPEGHINFTPGPTCAGLDELTVEITGRGVHNAYRENGVDAIELGHHVYFALNSLLNRISAQDDVVFVPTTVRGGTALGRTPDYYRETWALRTYTEKIRKYIIDEARGYVEHTANHRGGAGRLGVYRAAWPMDNDALLAELARNDLSKIGWGPRIDTIGGTMGGEDLARVRMFGIKTLLMRYGIFNEAIGAVHDLHTSPFLMNYDRLVPQAVELFVGMAEAFANPAVAAMAAESRRSAGSQPH